MGNAIHSLVFRPPKPTPIRPNKYFWLKIDKSGNRVPAFFIKRKNAAVTFLFSHGNAEDLGMLYKRMKTLARSASVNVLAYDYSGYGLSTGKPTQENCYKCIVAAYEHLRDVRKTKPEDIVLYGRSLGSGPTCFLAVKTAQEGKPVAGIILHSAFLSIFRVVKDFHFSLYGDMFKNIDLVSELKSPVLIMHGTNDKIVPFWHAPKLLSSINPNYRAEPYYAEGLGHNNIESKDKDEYTRRIKLFLQQHIPSATTIQQKENDMLKTKIKDILDKEPLDDTKLSRKQNFQSWFEQVWVKNWRSLWFINDLEEENKCMKLSPSNEQVNFKKKQKKNISKNCITEVRNQDYESFGVEITQSILNISSNSTSCFEKKQSGNEYYIIETNEEIEICPKKKKKIKLGTTTSCQKESNSEISHVSLATNAVDARNDYYDFIRDESYDLRG